MAMPSHATSGYTNYVCCPYKWALPCQNMWEYGSALTGTIKVLRHDGTQAFTFAGGLPAHDAAPVRCVKLPTASGDAEVSSLAAKQTDANAWN